MKIITVIYSEKNGSQLASVIVINQVAVTITYNKYIHVLKEQQAEAIQMIEIFLFFMQ